MSIYGNLITENSGYDLSRKDMLQISEILEECEVISEESLDILEEGANLDITKKFTTARKDYTLKWISYKKNVNAKEYDKAKEDLNNMKEIINQAIKDIKAIDSDELENNIAFYSTFVISILKLIVPTCIALYGGKKGFDKVTKTKEKGKDNFKSFGAFVGAASALIGFKDKVKKIISVTLSDIEKIGELSHQFKDKNTDNVNVFRNTIIDSLVKTRNHIDELQNKLLDKIKKEEEKKKEYESTNESVELDEVEVVDESLIVNKDDIYYNKDKFNSGETNLCLIIGFSGSGKSTMGNALDHDNKEGHFEHIDLDDVIDNWRFQDKDFDAKPELYKSFFKTSGKKYRLSLDQIKNYEKYDLFITNDFINFAKNAAKRNPNNKYVVEGVWIFYYMNPEEYKDYAVFIKGTSYLTSRIRAFKRDLTSKDKKPKKVQMSYVTKWFINKYENHFKSVDSQLMKWVHIYYPLYKKQLEAKKSEKEEN